MVIALQSPKKQPRKVKIEASCEKLRVKLTRKLNFKSLYLFKRTTVRTSTVTPKYIRRQAIQEIPLVQ